MVSIVLTPYDDPRQLFPRAAKKLGVKESQVEILKKSIDARHKGNIKIIYSVGVKGEQREDFFHVDTDKKVVVVGAGPCGLFCALTLCRHGIKPIVIERGSTVEARTKKMESFFNGGDLDCNTNVQFGEGGAGTFSDGKLNTGVNNRLIGRVLRDFVSFGAPEDILYLSKPHIGSDRLKSTIINLREHIKSLGGTFMFDTKVTDFNFKDGRIRSIVAGGSEIAVDYLVLAIGHSARDTYRTLLGKGVDMEQKEFAIGLRIEQLQRVMDEARYGKFAGFKTLPPSDYKLVSHQGGRGVFTFCMCPGGVVVPAQSEENTVVVNGMSEYLRDGKNANSAVVVQVKKEDFASSSPLSGMDLQIDLERRAFTLGGGGYKAPVCLAEDFISGRTPKSINGVLPTYRRGFEVVSLENLLPKPIENSLKLGLCDMDKRISGFASRGAILTGVETRTSAPVRILRDESFQSTKFKGLYPAGEGCGYAGGIMSAAIDGIKIATAIAEREVDKSC